MRLVAILALMALLVGCGGGATAPAPAAAPAPKSAEQPPQAAPKPAAEAKPAAESKPAAPAKPAAEKPAASAPKRLTIGAPPTTSSYYVYVVALSKLLQSKIPDVNLTVSEAGGAAINAKRLTEAKIDFSLTSFGALYPMYSGLDPAWKDSPQKDARALWVFDPAAHVWFVREESGITSVEQLQGKDFAAGGRGAGTEVLARLLIFPALGIEPKWYVGGLEDVQGAVKDRRILGMGKATAVARPDAVIMDIMTTTKLRILSWTPEQVQKVKATHPFLGTLDIPPGTYKAAWNERPITTWGDGIGMYTLAKFSNDLAYRFAKVAVEDSKARDSTQAEAYKGMAGFDMVKITLELSTVPLHAGVQKYYQEVGAKIPDHLKSPEAR